MRSLLLAFILLASLTIQAQTNFRSRTTGSWTTASTWQVETPNGSNVWVTASGSPDFNSNTINIRNGHTVTIGSNLTIDQTTLATGGTLQVLTGVTLTVNNGTGVDLFQLAGSNFHLVGESHISGAGYFYSNGTIHVYSANGTGAITSGTGATGNIRITTRYYGSSCVISYSGASKQYIGSGHPSTNGVSTIINNASGVEVNNTASTMLTFSGAVQVSSGQLIIANDNVTANQPITVNGGSVSFTNASGSARVHTINSLVLANGNVTVTTSLTAAVTINVSGLVNLAGGDILITSGSGNAVCNFYGDISGTGLINAQGNKNTIRFYGSNSFTHSFPIAQNSRLNLWVIDRPGLVLNVPHTLNITALSVNNGALTFSADQILTGALNLATGTSLNFSGATLELRSTVNATLSGGVLNSNSASNLLISGMTAGATTLPFNPTASLNSLTINRTGGGSVTLGNALGTIGSLIVSTGSFSVGANAMSVGSLTNSGTFTAPTTTLSLSGNLASTGTFTLGNCDLILTGTADQSLSTASVLQLNDVTLTKTAGTVRMNSSQNLSGVLTVSSGATFDADGISDNAVFTVLSTGDDAGSDASIAALPVGATVDGNVTVQRAWDALDDVYRYISSPVANSPISQLQTSGIPVTGPFVGSSYPCTGCDDDYTNLGWYDETVTGYIWEGYQVMPADGNDNTETLVPGRGYEVYMWNGVSPTLWSTRGTLNQGSYPLEVSFSPSSPALDTEDGWNLVGNPYPSSISWNDNTDVPGGWSMSNIDPVVWVWNVSTQSWEFFDASDNSGTLLNGKIATGQAFWVHTLAASTSLTVHEAAKTPVSGAYYRQREIPMLAINLSGNGSIQDNAFLTFDEETSDVPKFGRGVEAISLALSSDEGKRLARFSTTNTSTEIPISVVFKNEGNYKFSFASTGSSSDWESYYLVDRYLGKSTKINSSYTFAVTKNPATSEDRFYLSRTSEVAAKDDALSVSVYPNPVETSVLTVDVDTPGATNVFLLNGVGQVLKTNPVTYQEGKGSAQFEVADLPKGLYYVKIAGLGRKTYIHKVVKQ